MCTPILQRGDVVQVAFPVNSTDSPDKMRRDAEDLLKTYADYGITIAAWTANSALTAPVVVAILHRGGSPAPDSDD